MTPEPDVCMVRDMAPSDPVTKDTNPKAAFADKKVPFSALSAPVLGELGLALLEGALKYGRHNWRESGVRASTYFDAGLRHLFSWWEGEDIDPESGVHHLVKAMACLAVVRDAMIHEKFNDDRPPKTPAGWLEDLNQKSVLLREKYPNPKPPNVAKPLEQRSVVVEPKEPVLCTVPGCDQPATREVHVVDGITDSCLAHAESPRCSEPGCRALTLPMGLKQRTTKCYRHMWGEPKHVEVAKPLEQRSVVVEPLPPERHGFERYRDIKVHSRVRFGKALGTVVGLSSLEAEVEFLNGTRGFVPLSRLELA